MKCKKCQHDQPEVTASSVSCSHCEHNNAFHRSPASLAAHYIPSGNGEANLIQFPVTATTGIHNGSVETALPTWRDEVKEKVRQFREQRNVEIIERGISVASLPEPPNPILEAALKRIQRTTEALSIVPGISASSCAAPQAKPAVISTTDNAPGVAFRHNTAEQLESTPSETRLLNQPKTTSTTKNSARPVATPVSAEPIPAPIPQPSTSLQPALLIDRALASIFDLVLILLACIPFYSIHSIAELSLNRSVTYIVGIVVWMTFLYQFWTLLASQRTCGMAWRHLRITNAETHEFKISEWHIFARAIVATIALLFPPINLLIIWSSGNQSSLADVLSGTTLVKHYTSYKKLPPEP